MKSLSFAYQDLIKNNNVFCIQDQRVSSHEEIIALQDLLLTPGFHSLKAATRSSGRTIIDVFLMSLNYFNTIGCLTLHKNSLPHNIHNIYHQLVEEGYLEQGSDGIERFLVDAFYCDFLFIEIDDAMIKCNWLPIFQQKIIDLGIDTNIPIIYLLEDIS